MSQLIVPLHHSLTEVISKIISNWSSVKRYTALCCQVDVGGGKYVHLRVYQPLPHTGYPAELSGMQVNKTADDEITYF